MGTARHQRPRGGHPGTRQVSPRPGGTLARGSLAWCAVGVLAVTALGMQSAVGSDDNSSASGLQTSQYELPPAQAERPPRPPAAPQPAPPDNLPSSPSSSTTNSAPPLQKVHSAESASTGQFQVRSEAQELSVEPGSQPLLPADAPAWIGALPDTSGAVHHLHVGGLIAETPEEAATLLDEALVSAMGRYVEQSVVQRAGGARAVQKQLTADFIWKNLIDDRDGYLVRLNTSGIPMYQKWVTVSITPQQRDMIKDWNRQAVQRQRLAPVGVGVLGVLACVGVLHLIFKGRKPLL